MAELKTKETTESVVKFLNTIEDETRRKDCFEITEIIGRVSKYEPKCGVRQSLGLEVIIISMRVAMKEICA